MFPMAPGKSWKMGLVLKVLEILVQGPGKSWNFLGCDAGANAKICCEN